MPSGRWQRLHDCVGIIGVGIDLGRTEGRRDYYGHLVRCARRYRIAILTGRAQFAYGGSDASGNADTMVKQLGLSGVQFVNVKMAVRLAVRHFMQ